MKETINLWEYAPRITEALAGGILLNTGGDGFNAMVIGWGELGRVWGVPTFTVYVRENRHTKARLDSTGEFTVSIPLDAPIQRITQICGMQSGRDMDKVAEAGLTLEPARTVSTPGVREYPLTLECKVLYAQQQDLSRLPQDILQRYYPADVDGTAPLANRDAHTVYIGQIVDAYIIR